MSKKKTTISENFYNRLNAIMKREGLNQSAFARKVGLSPGFITDIKSGRGNVSPQTLEMICRIFSINESWLRTGEGQMEMTPVVAEANPEYVRQFTPGELEALDILREDPIARMMFKEFLLLSKDKQEEHLRMVMRDVAKKLDENDNKG